MSRWDAGPGAATGPVLIKLEWRMWTLTDRASGHAGLVQGLLDAPPFEAVSKEIIPSFACSSLSFRACCLVPSALLSTLLLLHECSLESNTSTVTASLQLFERRKTEAIGAHGGCGGSILVAVRHTLTVRFHLPLVCSPSCGHPI